MESYRIMQFCVASFVNVTFLSRICVVAGSSGVFWTVRSLSNRGHSPPHGRSSLTQSKCLQFILGFFIQVPNGDRQLRCKKQAKKQ